MTEGNIFQTVHTRWGGGVPHPRSGWGRGGYPLSRSGQGGCPHPRSGGYALHQQNGSTPHPGQDGGGGCYPQTEQHSVYLLHGGWYVPSCRGEGVSHTRIGIPPFSPSQDRRIPPPGCGPHQVRLKIFTISIA